MGKAKLHLWFSKLQMKSGSTYNSNGRSSSMPSCAASSLEVEGSQRRRHKQQQQVHNVSEAGDDRHSQEQQVHNVLLLTPVRSSRSSNPVLMQGISYHVPPCSASGPAFSPISPLRLKPSAAQALMMLRSPARPPVNRTSLSSSSSSNPRPDSSKLQHSHRHGNSSSSKSSVPVDCGCSSFSRMSRYQAMAQDQRNDSAAVVCNKMGDGGVVLKWKKKRRKKKKKEAAAGASTAGNGENGYDDVGDQAEARSGHHHRHSDMAMHSSKNLLRSLSILSKDCRGLDSHPLLWDSSVTSDETFFSSFDRDRHRRSFSSNSSSSDGIKQQNNVITMDEIKMQSNVVIAMDGIINQSNAIAANDRINQSGFVADKATQRNAVCSDRIKYSNDGIRQNSVFATTTDRIKQSDAFATTDRILQSNVGVATNQNPYVASSTHVLQRTPPSSAKLPHDSFSSVATAALASSTQGYDDCFIPAQFGIPAAASHHPGYTKVMRKEMYRSSYGNSHSGDYGTDGPSSRLTNGRRHSGRYGDVNQFAQYHQHNRVHSAHYHQHDDYGGLLGVEMAVEARKWAEFAGQDHPVASCRNVQKQIGDNVKKSSNRDEKHQQNGIIADSSRSTASTISDEMELFQSLQTRWKLMGEEQEAEEEQDGEERWGRGAADQYAESADCSASHCGDPAGCAAGHRRWRVAESLAVVKSSRDPLVDFRDSMVDMILENDICSAEDMEELLRCFLSLNSQEHHATIATAFAEVWQAVFDD